ncbi:MAG: hypothetical protein IT432_00870 [Phycisphaerales bacterium]|nr:hypothetical protein [Phycisphaerales bacterium]
MPLHKITIPLRGDAGRSDAGSWRVESFRAEGDSDHRPLLIIPATTCAALIVEHDR